ncbi:MAG: DMT family transporter [Oscillospiraceae bacterium]|nr:DMT family transporter [Oscillospiraceae bacterium]
MTKEKTATLEMLLCAALWSIAGIFIKLIPWNAFAVAGMRSLVAGVTIYICMRLMGCRYVLNRRTLIVGFFAGCTYLCFVTANKLTTSANAIVLQFTSPIFIVLYSALFFKKPVRKWDLAVVLVTLFGIALFFLDQLKPGYILGNFVAIAAGMFMAGMFVAVGELDTQERFSGIVNGQILTFLAGLPVFLLTKPAVTGAIVLYILILGVFQLGLSYVLYVRASRYCPPLACCLLGAVEPLLNPVWVAIFDGERPGVFALLGAVVVIVSITVWSIFGQEKGQES